MVFIYFIFHPPIRSNQGIACYRNKFVLTATFLWPPPVLRIGCHCAFIQQIDVQQAPSTQHTRNSVQRPRQANAKEEQNLRERERKHKQFAQHAQRQTEPNAQSTQTTDGVSLLDYRWRKQQFSLRRDVQANGRIFTDKQNSLLRYTQTERERERDH